MVKVEMTQRRRARAGQATKSLAVSADTHDVVEVLMCLRVSARANKVSVSDVIAEFIEFSVGGVMSWEENTEKTHTRTRNVQGFGGSEWCDELARARYVDDVTMMSPCYTPTGNLCSQVFFSG